MNGIPQEPLVSILINNYNYGSFVGEAIQSALNQAYSNLEVIVVDDGSTDESQQVILRYADRVQAVFKENGGQASAFNAGFEASHGEILFFLDADDLLAPDVVQRVVAVFREHPDAAKVHFRVKVVDRALTPTGEFIPPPGRKLPSGDLRQSVARYGTYIWPPTSGNAFGRRALRRILPIEDPSLHSISADAYICNLAAVLGPVFALEGYGALYRVHGTNHFYRVEQHVNLSRMRHSLRRTDDIARKQGELLQKTEWGQEAIGRGDVGYWITRMISLKLDHTAHAYPDRWGLLLTRVFGALWQTPIYRWYEKAAWSFWVVLLAVCPFRYAPVVAQGPKRLLRSAVRIVRWPFEART